jgi:phage terminase small subunit
MLTPKQQRFVAELLADPARNATKAAISAGYSRGAAHVTGSRLLRQDKISEAVGRTIRKLEVRAEITQARVLSEVALLAFSDVTHYQVDDFGNLTPAPGAPEGVMRAVSSIKRRTTTDSEGGVTREVEFRLWDKPGIVKLAGRHVGLFPTKDHEAMKAAARELLEEKIEEARRRRSATDTTAEVAPRPALKGNRHG